MFPKHLPFLLLLALHFVIGLADNIFIDLKDFLDIQTFVLYDYHNRGSLMDDLPVEEVKSSPHVVITQKVNWTLKEYFSGLILSVVFVGSGGNEDILNIFEHTMQRWHLKYVLFITREKLEPLLKWRSLFHWCHTRGYFNTLLVDLAGSIAAYDHFGSQLVFRTNLRDFINYRKYFYNSHGFPIRAILGNSPPRSLIWYDAQDNIHVSGYYGKVLSLFAKNYNATLEFVILSQLEYYDEMKCLEYIVNQTADLCANGMVAGHGFITTRAEEISESFLIVPYDEPLDRFYYFLKPFGWEVWLLLLSSILYKSLNLAFIHRLQGKTWDFGLNALHSMLSVLNLSFELSQLLGWRRRFLEFIMFLFGFVVANWYLSVLSSILFTRLYTDYINTLEDLVKYNISIMINDVEKFTLNGSDISPLISQQLLLVDTDTLLYHRRNLIPTYAYYSQYDKNMFYLSQQKYMLRPRMKELTHIPINPIYAGIPMRANWPLEDRLNNHMRYMIDSGIYLRLLLETFDDGIRIGHVKYFPTEHHAVEPLNWEYFQMAGILLLGGCLLGIVSFVMEILINQ